MEVTLANSKSTPKLKSISVSTVAYYFILTVLAAQRIYVIRFICEKRPRPMVPAPSCCPMPDRERSADRRARLYLLYLRPWTLVPSWADKKYVPHICDLNLIRGKRVALHGKQAEGTYSYDKAWRQYISEGVVSRHAHLLIVQFMAACCGKSKTINEECEQAATKPDRHVPANEVVLAQIHAMLDDLGTAPIVQSQTTKPKKRAKLDVNDSEDDGHHEKRSQQIEQALSTTTNLWRRDPNPWQVKSENLTNSRLGLREMPKQKAGRRTKSQKKEPESEQAHAYVHLTFRKHIHLVETCANRPEASNTRAGAFLGYSHTEMSG